MMCGRLRLGDEENEMTNGEWTPQKVVNRGEAIYQNQLRSQVEAGNKGKFLVIDVNSGDYEIDQTCLMCDPSKGCLRLRPGRSLAPARRRILNSQNVNELFRFMNLEKHG